MSQQISNTERSQLILRDYQQEGLSALRKALRNGCQHPLISVPTGGGKTPMIISLIASLINEGAAERFNLQFIIIEYTKELVNQTAKLLASFTGISPSIEQGQHHADPNATVVIACAASLVDRIAKYDLNRKRLILIDEAHHSVTKQTGAILKGFGVAKTGSQNSGSALVGWTATPARADGVGLDSVFDQIVYEVEIEKLIQDGWLARPLGYRIHSETDLEQVSLITDEFGNQDFDPNELAKAVDTDPNNQLIVDCYMEICKDLPTIVFCCKRSHADRVAARFESSGVKAVALHYKSGTKKIKRSLEALKKRQISVLVNVNLFAEGWDYPGLSAAILARPTKSEPLYRQQCGRVMRAYPGKSYCLLVDIVHNSTKHNLTGLHCLLGLPPHLINEQKNKVDLLAAKNEIEQFRKQHPQVDLSRILSLESLKKLSHIESFDVVLAEPAEELWKISNLPWLRNDGRTYTLALSNKEYLVLEKNLLAQFHISLWKVGQSTDFIATAGSLEEACRLAENHIESHYKDRIKLLSRDARWRELPPSEKQLRYIEKRNLDFKGNTAGDANVLITARIAAEQKSTISSARKLIGSLLSDQRKYPLRPNAVVMVKELKEQADKGAIDQNMYWRVLRINAAAQAEGLINEMNRQNSSPFFKSIQNQIEEIYNSNGERGFISNGAIQKLEQIFADWQAKAAI